MITEFFYTMAAGFASWVISLFDGMATPQWVGSFSDILAQVVAGGSGMGSWVPWALLWGVIGVTLLIWLTGFTVKSARWLVGWVPTMGGS
jgi:hypothetical protein